MAALRGSGADLLRRWRHQTLCLGLCWRSVPRRSRTPAPEGLRPVLLEHQFRILLLVPSHPSRRQRLRIRLGIRCPGPLHGFGHVPVLDGPQALHPRPSSGTEGGQLLGNALACPHPSGQSPARSRVLERLRASLLARPGGGRQSGHQGGYGLRIDPLFLGSLGPE